MIEGKYKLSFSKELLIDYYDNLLNDCFKLLPIYEGRDFKTKKIIYTPEEAHKNYIAYLSSFLNEICGGYYMFNNIYFLKLMTNLSGMMSIKINEHRKLKPLVFKCINLINKLKEEIDNDS